MRGQLPAEYGALAHVRRRRSTSKTAHLLPGYILSSQGDRMAMAHGVEGRLPFLDPRRRRVRDLCLPANAEDAGAQREISAETCRPRTSMPAPVRTALKRPYRAPGAKSFLVRPRRRLCERLLSARQVQRDGIFRPRAWYALVRKFRDGKGDRRPRRHGAGRHSLNPNRAQSLHQPFRTVNPWNASLGTARFHQWITFCSATSRTRLLY